MTIFSSIETVVFDFLISPFLLVPVLQYHPDIVGKTAVSMQKFRDVQDAYKVLSTPELKAELDKIVRTASAKTASSATIVPGRL